MRLIKWIKGLLLGDFKNNKKRLNNDRAVEDLMRWGNYIEVQSKYI